MNAKPLSLPRQAGIYVRAAREAQALTRAQLAQRAGVSERLLASLELGDATGIRLDKLLAVCSALGLTLWVSDGADAQPTSTAFDAQASTTPPKASPRPLSHKDDLDYDAHYRAFIRSQGIDLLDETEKTKEPSWQR